MAQLNFDITADTSGFQEKVNGLVTGVNQLSDVMQKIKSQDDGGLVDFSSTQAQINTLRMLLKNADSDTAELVGRLQAYGEQYKEAFASGDFALADTISADMQQVGTEIEQAIGEANELRSALTQVSGMGVVDQPQQTVTSPMYFDTQEAYEEAEALRQKVAELEEQVASFDGSPAGMADLQSSLSDTRDELREAESAAADNAAALGDGLGSRAADVSTTLYEMNAAVEQQQQKVDALTETHNTLVEALNAARESEDPTAITEATEAYEASAETLTNAENELRNMQAAQQDCQAQWQGVTQTIDAFNAMGEKHEGVLMKLVGGTDNWNKMLGMMPASVRSVVTSVTSMTKASLAFIATPLGMILGAIALALTSVYNWFTKTTEGQKAFANISGYVGGVLGKLQMILTDVGQALYKAFSDPKQAVKDLWNFIKDNFVTRLKALGHAFNDFGGLIKAVFSLDKDQMKTYFMRYLNDIAEVSTGIKDVTKKVTDAAKELHRVGKEGASIKVEEMEVEQNEAKWKTDKESLKQKQAGLQAEMWSQDPKKARAAMEEYEKIQKQITDGDKKFMEKRMELHRRGMEISPTNLQDEIKLQDYKTQVATIDTQYAMRVASLARRKNMIERREQTAAKKAASDKAKADKESKKNAAETASLTDEMTAKAQEVKDRLSAGEFEAAKEANEAYFDLQKQRLDLMDEGFDKEVAKLKYQQDYRQKQFEIEREEYKREREKKARELFDMQQSEAKIAFKRAHVGDKSAHFTPQTFDLEAFLANADNAEQVADLMGKDADYLEKKQKLITETSAKEYEALIKNMYATAPEKDKAQAEQAAKNVAQIQETIAQETATRQTLIEREKNGEIVEDEKEACEQRLRLLTDLLKRAQDAEALALYNTKKSRLAYLKAYGTYLEQRQAAEEEYQANLLRAGSDEWAQRAAQKKYEAALLKIEEAWQKPEIQLQLKTGDASAQIDALCRELSLKLRKATTEAEKAILSEEYGGKVAKVLFGSKGATAKEVNKAKKEAETLLALIEGRLTGQEETDVIARFGFTPEGLERLKESGALLESIGETLTRQSSARYEGSSIVSLFSNLKTYYKAKDKLKDPTLSKKDREVWEGVASKSRQQALGNMCAAASNMADGLGRAAEYMQQLGEATGSVHLQEMGEMMKGMSSIMKSTAQGAASGGWIGAIVSFATSALDQIVQSFIKTKASLYAIRTERTALEREIELMAVTIKSEDYDGIFGTEEAIKAIDAYKKGREALKEYSREIGKVINMRIKTVDRGWLGNLFGKADKIENLRDYAPEIFDTDARGMTLDVDKAQAFLDTTSKLSDEQRKQIQYVIDLKKAYDDAYKTVEDYLSTSFSSMAGELADALISSVRQGTDAWDDFQEVGTKAIQSLIKQMAQSMLITQYLEPYKQQLLDAFMLSDEQTSTNQLLDTVDKMMTGLHTGMERMQTVVQAIDDKATSMGYDVAGLESVSTKKGVGAMTEDTANELNGRFTAMQLYVMDLQRQSAGSLAESITHTTLLTASNKTLADMLTGQARANSYLEDITRYTKTLIDIRTSMQEVSRNTKAI